jgi:hypothetical protein
MFDKVNNKLERAKYCVENLKGLGLGSQPWRAHLDCFFFEIISAKDLFLQEINDKYQLGLPRDDATKIPKLKRQLNDRATLESDSLIWPRLLEVIKSIEKKLCEKGSWLWTLNNYRNSATHRDLLHIGFEAEIPAGKDLFDRIRRGEVTIRPIFKGQEKEIPPDVPKVVVPLKSYLFKDPEDISQGNADIEVIPYCEQALDNMRDFLDKLYSKLS